VVAFLFGRLVWAVAVVAFTALFAYGGLRLLRPELYPGQGWLEGVRGDLDKVFLHGDLGPACFQIGCPPLNEYVVKFFPADIYLLLGALSIGVVGGFLAGVWCASRPRSRGARALEAFAMLALCTPAYVVGLTLLLLFAPLIGVWELPWFFDLHVYVSPTDDPWTFFRALLVPCLVVAAPLAAVIMRVTMGLTIETLGEDYVRTARAKGLSHRQTVRRHGAPTTYVPVAALTGVSVPILVLNMALVETVFNVPGVFRFIRKAIIGPTPPGPNPDYESLQALSMYTAIFIALATLLVDMALAALDPRIRDSDRVVR
jgi:peptide/nickel transport system permease protein